MHCNGKCLLMKKIQSEQKKEQKNPELKGENKHEVVLLTESTSPHSGQPQRNTYYAQLCIGNVVHQSHSIFHPPCV